MKVTLKKNQFTERDFWKYYLHLRNTSLESLTKTELRVLTEVLTGDPYKSMFKGVSKTKMIENLKMTSKSSRDVLSKYKASLVKKGFLAETGVERGDVLVSQPLRSFQLKIKEAIKKKEDITLRLEFLFHEV